MATGADQLRAPEAGTLLFSRRSVYWQLLKRSELYQGLGLIATCSALLVPVCLELIFSHRSQWFIGQDADAWQEASLLWLWRAHAISMSFLLSGWAADRALFFPTHAPRARLALPLGLIAVAVSVLTAAPGWLWLTRLDLVGGGTVTIAALLDAVPLLLAGTVSSYTGHRLPAPLAMLCGVLASMCFIGISWGWLS
ncbi:MAG: hypothetical protein VYD19_01150 [Myxococcota bacterium]|nr:hypothetical protein [Myxococcota bacterium]